MKKSYGLWLALVAVWMHTILLSACANMVPPVGGPKDTLAPEVLRAVPENGTLRFRGNRITLQFNEYVQLNNAFENVIVTPSQENFPQIDSRLRTVSIRLKDTLEPNTTYAIHFGDAIRDVNENNPVRNFSYVFSTGNYIDSFTLGGKVSIAQTGKVDSTLMVMLHRNLDDSAVAKQRPRYYTRVNAQGNFLFENLPAGTFRLYALKDEGFRRYSDNKSVFAFADSAVRIGPANPPVQLYAFVADPGEAPANRAAATREATKEGKNDKQLQYQVGLQNGEQDLLSNLKIGFNRPLRTFDSSKIRLTDTSYQPITGYRWQADSNQQNLTLFYRWKEDQPLRLLVAKDAVTDSAGTTLTRTDTIRFRTKAESAYGSLSLRFSGVDFSRHPVLQWIQNDQPVRSDVLPAGTWNARLFIPGNYELRILYDENRNGVWDTGDFWKHRQPEKVIAVNRAFNIRANWDNEFDVSLAP